MTATLTADYDAVLYGRSTCDDPTSEVDCSDDGLLGEEESVTATASAGPEPERIR
jgi:hypothetical protein